MPSHNGLLVEVVVNGPFMENCYLVAEERSRQAILVDPGDEDSLLLERVRDLDLQVQEIVCTHAHVDHVGAVAPLQRALGVPFAIHPQETAALATLPLQARMFGLHDLEVPAPDRELRPGETLTVGALTATVLFTPGHSAGGCCLHFAAQGVVLVGDTLFAGSIGRTDLPGGSLPTLLRGIREELLTLPDDTVVYSGHGPATTIGQERRSNPFLQGDPSRFA